MYVIVIETNHSLNCNNYSSTCKLNCLRNINLPFPDLPLNKKLFFIFSESKFFHGKNIFLEIFDEFGTLGTAIMWFFTCPMSHLGQKNYFSWDMGQVWDSYNVTLRNLRPPRWQGWGSSCGRTAKPHSNSDVYRRISQRIQQCTEEGCVFLRTVVV